jgi:hypothetical protein
LQQHSCVKDKNLQLGNHLLRWKSSFVFSPPDF